jgi:hypothetical protein
MVAVACRSAREWQALVPKQREGRPHQQAPAAQRVTLLELAALVLVLASPLLLLALVLLVR